LASICLNMIVKDEAHVIRRCLDSVLPLINAWCILDTGSTDGTQEIVREHLKHLPGELHESPWKGFGPSRTEAIQLALGRGDYLLFIDADDELVLPKKFRLPELKADSYYIQHRQDAFSFLRLDLVSTRFPWRYKGVLHEYIESDAPRQALILQGPHVVERREGARSRDPRKYERDAEVLEQGLRDEPDNARYMFYLAQSRRDAQQYELALEAYVRRVAMGGWEEEIYISLLSIARIMETLEQPDSEVIHAYLAAYQARPQRAETLGSLAAFFRFRRQYNLALLFAEKGLATPRPADLLFVDDSYYTWRCLDEFAVACSWLGRHRNAVKTCDRLLTTGVLPPGEVQRVKANRELCARVLQGSQKPGRAGVVGR
jgi:glycosyltransferase involved in cell wall biosynthesis